MEERRWDDSVKLTDGLTKDLFEEMTVALKDSANRFVAIHKPGSRIKMQDGSVYEVQHNGAWKKVTNE